jgi:hypothetical protein
MSHGGAAGVMAKDTPGTGMIRARARLVKIIDKCLICEYIYDGIIMFCT